jgi:hypothetical protein
MAVIAQRAEVSDVAEFAVDLDARLEPGIATPAVLQRVLQFRVRAAGQLAFGDEVQQQLAGAELLLQQRADFQLVVTAILQGMGIFDQQAHVHRIATLLEELENVLPDHLRCFEVLAGRLLPFGADRREPEPGWRVLQFQFVFLAAVHRRVVVDRALAAHLHRGLAFLDDGGIDLVGRLGAGCDEQQAGEHDRQAGGNRAARDARLGATEPAAEPQDGRQAGAEKDHLHAARPVVVASQRVQDLARQALLRQPAGTVPERLDQRGQQPGLDQVPGCLRRHAGRHAQQQQAGDGKEPGRRNPDQPEVEHRADDGAGGDAERAAEQHG